MKINIQSAYTILIALVAVSVMTSSLNSFAQSSQSKRASVGAHLSQRNGPKASDNKNSGHVQPQNAQDGNSGRNTEKKRNPNVKNYWTVENADGSVSEFIEYADGGSASILRNSCIFCHASGLCGV